MKRSIICAAVAAVSLFVGVPLAARADCVNPNSLLNATYGWHGESLLSDGSQKPKIGHFVPLVQNGHLIFDGNGNFSGAHDTSLGGELIAHADSGTYSVNSDCATGTIFFATGNHFVMSFVITSGAQEIKYVSAQTGGVASGTLRRMGSAPCSATTLSGNSYGYATQGLLLLVRKSQIQRLLGFEPFSSAGQILFAADGSVSGVDNENLAGVVIPGRIIAGTYSVNSDCTGTTTMTIDGADQSWNFVILQDANQITFVAIPSGIVWGGTLTLE